MDYTQIFEKALSQDPFFQGVLDAVRRNSAGKIWLVGGTVFSKIAEEIYFLERCSNKECDYDFILEKIANNQWPDGWQPGKNTFGNPKILAGEIKIDILPIDNIASIRRRNLEPTIENFLTGTSFNIQSIAYDLAERKIIGETGIRAIRTKTISINDLESLDHYCALKNIPSSEYIKTKFEAWKYLGFEMDDSVGIGTKN